jgi:hypothetical protein
MEKIKGSYDFVLNYLTLVSHDGVEYDFSSHLIELTYNENIFSPTVYGHLSVIDTLDYASLLPIMGEERLRASFTRPDEQSKTGKLLDPIKFDFAVYKMQGRLNQNFGSGKAQTYSLMYVSDDVYTNVGTKICKKYSKMKYSDMVKKIHAEYLLPHGNSKLEVEETSGEYTYYAQFISPYDAIKTIALRSISNQKNGFNYVFYRDRDGYKFKTISSMAKQDPYLSITYSPKSMPDDKLNELYSVNAYTDDVSIDTLNAAAIGEAASTLLSVDPVRRKFYLKAFDLRGQAGFAKHKIPLLQNSDWKEFPHIEKHKNFLDSGRLFGDPRANMSMVITDFGHRDSTYISERDADIYQHDPEYYLLQTESHFKQIQSKILSVTLTGHPGVRAGSIINFALPEVVGRIGKRDKEELDRYLQGRYIVTHVTHIIKRNKYQMNLKIVKDSYFNQIKSRDPVKENQKVF